METKTEETILCPFVCGLCSFSSNEIKHFENHLKSHTVSGVLSSGGKIHVCLTKTESGEKPFKCYKCSGVFLTMCNLNTHLSDCSSDRSYIVHKKSCTAFPLNLDNFLSILRSDSEDFICNDQSDSNSFGFEEDFLQSLEVKIREMQKNISSKKSCLASVTDTPPKAKKQRAKKKKVEAKNAILNLKSKVQNSILDNSKDNIDEPPNGLDEDDGNSIENRDNSTTSSNCDKIENETSNNDIKLTDIDNIHNYCAPENHNASIDHINGDVTNNSNQTVNMLVVKEPRTKQSQNRKVKLKKQKDQGCSGNSSSKKMPKLKTCEYCGIQKSHSRMQHHLKAHFPERPFKCDKCPKAYKYKSHLQDHYKTHSETLPLCCDQCGKGYTNITRLRYHVLAFHSKQQPFQCEECGAGFVTKYALSRHSNKHTGKKAYQCDICGMRFCRKENLQGHVKNIHKQEQRFSCTQCSKKFVTNYQLKCHEMKHSGLRPYHCKICSAEYIEKKELRRHMVIQHNRDLNSTDLATVVEQAPGVELESSLNVVKREASVYCNVDTMTSEYDDSNGQTHNISVQETTRASTVLCIYVKEEMADTLD